MNLGHEDEYTEFKKSTSELKEGVESIASILNKHGEGTLYFGVGPDGEVRGQDVSETTLRKISQAVGNSIDPAIYPIVAHEKTPDGKDYVKVAFSGNDGPYACNGKFRIRVADEDVLMSPRELRQSFRDSESRLNPWDSRVSTKTIEDVDEPTLRRFVERGREKGRIRFEYTGVKDALGRLGLMEGDHLLNAGAALFCPSPIDDLKMGVFASHARTEIIGLQHESGTLFELVRSAEMFVISNTRSRVDTSGPGASDVYPEIPTKALHEALMNAYAHRDWEYGGAVMVELFNDAVEIISPGWFIEGQDPEAHLSGKDASSVSRNKLLAQTLYKSGDIESQGTGIKRIKDECDEAGIEVEYVEVPSGTKLIFHRNDAFGQSLVIDNVLDIPTDNPTDVGINVGINVGLSNQQIKKMGLNRTELATLNELSANPRITAAEIASKLDITERSVERAIKRLREEELVEREGSRKTGRWIVKE